MNRSKILPSEKISNELSELFLNGKGTQEDLLGLILKKSLQKTVQELLEEEFEKNLEEIIMSERRKHHRIRFTEMVMKREN